MYIFNLVHTFKLTYAYYIPRGKDLPIEIVAFRYFNFMCRKDFIHVYSRVKVTTIFKKNHTKSFFHIRYICGLKMGKKCNTKKGVQWACSSKAKINVFRII